MPINGNLQSKRPGICTIRASGGDWIVCPNRLFALDSVNPPDLRHFSELSTSVQYVLNSIRATPGEAGLPIGIWREIAISGKQDNKVFDYRFDFILNPVSEVTSVEFADDWSIDHAPVSRAFKRANTLFAPKRTLGYPIIVEVMTASTSGSDESKGTGMKQAFYSAWDSVINGSEIEQNAPGVNIRQVWGRMASQLIAKSEAGEHWGGRTVWIMQDKLLRYIHDTTGLSHSYDVSDVSSPLPLKEANIVSFRFSNEPEFGHTRPITLDRFIGDNIPDMYNALGEPTMHGILHAAFLPDSGVMALKLLESQQRKTSAQKLIILP